MTLVEVMIILFILTIAVLGVMTHTYTLSQARNQALEQSQVQQIAGILVERFQGATWGDLASWDQPTGPGWAKPRFKTGAPVNPPMTDNDPIPGNNLQTLGVLIAPSGVPDLKVYVEYYCGGFKIGTPLLENTAINSRPAWNAALPPNRLDLGTQGIDNNLAILSQYQHLVVIRLLLTWKETAGVPALTHEVTTIRKR